jgi:hypothetical protein
MRPSPAESSSIAETIPMAAQLAVYRRRPRCQSHGNAISGPVANAKLPQAGGQPAVMGRVFGFIQIKGCNSDNLRETTVLFRVSPM